MDFGVFSKIRFNEIKYMRGYNSNVNLCHNNYSVTNRRVCSTYSLDLWNRYSGGVMTISNAWSPADVRDVIIRNQ